MVIQISTLPQLKLILWKTDKRAARERVALTAVDWNIKTSVSDEKSPGMSVLVPKHAVSTDIAGTEKRFESSHSPQEHDVHVPQRRALQTLDLNKNASVEHSSKLSSSVPAEKLVCTTSCVENPSRKDSLHQSVGAIQPLNAAESRLRQILVVDRKVGIPFVLTHSAS